MQGTFFGGAGMRLYSGMWHSWLLNDVSTPTVCSQGLAPADGLFALRELLKKSQP